MLAACRLTSSHSVSDACSSCVGTLPVTRTDSAILPLARHDNEREASRAQVARLEGQRAALEADLREIGDSAARADALHGELEAAQAARQGHDAAVEALRSELEASCHGDPLLRRRVGSSSAHPQRSRAAAAVLTGSRSAGVRVSPSIRCDGTAMARWIRCAGMARSERTVCIISLRHRSLQCFQLK